MLTQVVQLIGWKGPNDRDTIIRKEQLEESIVRLQKMSSELEEIGGSVGKYVHNKGINTVRDVLVVLRRLARLHNHAVIYKRASKNKNNTPVYLYQLI